MKKNSNLVATAVLLIIFATAVILFFSRGSSLNKEGIITIPESPSSNSVPTSELNSELRPLVRADYPSNLIDAEVESIAGKALPTTIRVKAKVDKILIDPPLLSKEINLKAGKNLIVTLFDLSTEKESPLRFEDLSPGDQIVAELSDGDNSSILQVDTYSVRKIRKMVVTSTQ